MSNCVGNTAYSFIYESFGGAIHLSKYWGSAVPWPTTGMKVTITDSVFYDNEQQSYVALAASGGGAIYSKSESFRVPVNLELTNVTLRTNKAAKGAGGALWLGQGTTAALTNVHVLNNNAESTTYSGGGAIFTESGGVDLTLTSVIATGNTVNYASDGDNEVSAAQGGFLYADEKSLINVYYSKCYGNTAQSRGGCLASNGAIVNLYYSHLYNNTVTYLGSEVMLEASDMFSYHSSFKGSGEPKSAYLIHSSDSEVSLDTCEVVSGNNRCLSTPRMRACVPGAPAPPSSPPNSLP